VGWGGGEMEPGVGIHTEELLLPPALQEEFATVAAVWSSGGKTKGVDALLLSWVKYEKQFRHLFCFLVYQHPSLRERIDRIDAFLVSRTDLYPETFIHCINEMGPKSVPDLLSPHYDKLWPEVGRIKGLRRKLMHGLTTGEGTGTDELRADVCCLLKWIAELATGARAALGYDGLERNTAFRARNVSKVLIAKYPFSTFQDFEIWVSKLAKLPRNPPQVGAKK